jgi:hypothetical protein
LSDTDDGPPPPPDREATWETASTLTFGACGTVKGGQGNATVVLSRDGVCVLSEMQSDTCNTYATMEVTINGVPLKRVSSGGWSSAPSFAPRFPGDHGYGCFFPRFELPCASPDRCFTKDLFTDTGTVDLTVRIGGEARTFTAERWLGERTLRLASGPLVQGRVASVEAGPRGGGNVSRETGDDSIGFVYDDTKLNTSWCAIKHNAQPWTTTTYDPSGECREACCSSSDVVEVAPSSWHKDGFDFVVPNDLPPGAGRLVFWETRRSVAVTGCPFAECRVRIDRSSSLRTVVTSVKD